MKTQAQRAAKRHKRENRDSKESTWYCAGCKGRHPNGHACPQVRLRANGFNRVPKDAPLAELFDAIQKGSNSQMPLPSIQTV